MILRCLFGTFCSVGLVVAAAAAQNTTQTAPPDAKSATVIEMTLAGCLMRHRDVPVAKTAAAPDPAAKHDGFLLVDAMAVQHHQGTSGMRTTAAPAASPHDHAAADPRPVVSPTPNVADSQMFKVEGLSDAELEQFAGTRVTLMGALIADDSATRTRTAAMVDGHDAAPFKATMIHPAASPCRQ
jgi:hypothetical protein